MFLSRAGLDLSKIARKQGLQMESDESNRRLARQAATGDPEELAAHARASWRSGDEGPGRRYMAPYVNAYREADHKHAGEILQNVSNERKRAAAIKANKAHKELHAAAERIGEHPGLFWDKPAPSNRYPDNPNLDATSNMYATKAHVSQLARVHGADSHRYESDRSNRPPGSASFKSHEERESFIKSLKHHYPEMSHQTDDQRPWPHSPMRYVVHYNHGMKFKRQRPRSRNAQ